MEYGDKVKEGQLIYLKTENLDKIFCKKILRERLK